MFQYLTFDAERATNQNYRIIELKEASKLIAKNFLFALFLAYSTLFLAVATPFVKPHNLIIYFVGSFITLFFVLRFLNNLIKYLKYKNYSINFNSNYVSIDNGSNLVSINSVDIEYIAYNFFSNIVIHEKNRKTIFPLGLLSKDDSQKIINQLRDIAPRRTSFYQKSIEVLDAILMAMILAIHIIQFVIQNFYIPSGSMENTLMKDDHLFAEKITYGPSIPQMLGMKEPIHLKFLGIRKVQPGDVIIFKPPAITGDEDKDYIKRCIAVEGQKFEIKNGQVYIDGKLLKEAYTKGITEPGNIKINGIVPKGHVVALGDNRSNSRDSRYFGYLDVKRIKAKAFFLYWNRKQFLKWDFHRLGLIK